MEFSLSPNLAPQSSKMVSPSDSSAAEKRASASILKLVRPPETEPKVADNPLREVLADFRSDLTRYINTEEVRQPSIGFAIHGGSPSPSLERLKVASRNIVQRLEEISFGSEFAPADQFAATQVQEQVELFSSFLRSGFEQRDPQIEQVAIKIKSMVSQVIHQLDGGVPETQVSQIEQLLAAATQHGGAVPLEFQADEGEEEEYDDE